MSLHMNKIERIFKMYKNIINDYIMETIYNCEHWKKEFREAAFRKLRGENSEFIERIINKISPCNIQTIQETTRDIIKQHKIDSKK